MLFTTNGIYYFAQYFRSIVWKKWENLLSLIKEISLIVNKFEVDCVTYKKSKISRIIPGGELC